MPLEEALVTCVCLSIGCLRYEQQCRRLQFCDLCWPVGSDGVDAAPDLDAGPPSLASTNSISNRRPTERAVSPSPPRLLWLLKSGRGNWGGGRTEGMAVKANAQSLTRESERASSTFCPLHFRPFSSRSRRTNLIRASRAAPAAPF